MNWDQIAGNWKQVASKREQLAGSIQQHYGIAKEQAEKDVDEFVNALNK